MTHERSDRLIPAGVLLPFVLVTSLFALWGFANDVTNPMVKAFSRILLMSNFEGSLVQFAFYGGYFAMAFPAALFIKRYSYKAGILVGLALYAGGALLGVLAVAGFVLVAGTIALPGVTGLYCLVGVSACMSLMFPTIYGIALRGMGDDAKLGAAGLIMAILGGSVLPPVQAAIMDGSGLAGLSAVRLSFVVPLLCFVIVARYGFRTRRAESAA
jgi:fucose permease